MRKWWSKGGEQVWMKMSKERSKKPEKIPSRNDFEFIKDVLLRIETFQHTLRWLLFDLIFHSGGNTLFDYAMVEREVMYGIKYWDL